MRGMNFVVFLTVAAAAWWAPRDALACGGTFCDGSGPTPMPVDQTGENVLFIQDGPAIEAHIQIQYTGEPQRFAWVVPVPAIPEFRVGSDLLFRELLRASAPSYVNRPMPNEVCAETLTPWLLAAPLMLPLLPVLGAYGLIALPWVIGALTPGCAAEADAALLEGENVGGSAEVVFQDSVGAFDITVLSAGTAEEVARWLSDNDYNVPIQARPILAQYARENSLFAAVKLVSTAQVDEIHPIVLRYAYGVPCVPLRLTAVAAASNMGARTFFLGQARTVPRTYRHVVVNPAQVDWLNAGANYMDVVSRAVDEGDIEGQAFLTEYAGSSSVVLVNNFYWWDRVRTGPPEDADDAVGFLEARGLMTCGTRPSPGAMVPPVSVTGTTPENSCTFYHPLVRGLLQDHLPPPSGVTELQYWSNARAYPSHAAFNSDAFLQDYEDRINTPARRALALVRDHGHLTRLFTTISPEEMTVDPEFHERPDLPDVPNILTATSVRRCDGFTTFTLPDGRTVEVPPGSAWPVFGEKMPWAMRVEDISDPVELLTLSSRETDVDAELATWNKQRQTSVSPQKCACTQPRDDFAWPTTLLAFAFVVARRRLRSC
ncbi:MAG: DUF2330 domain-containing protein [Myxococcota bacterium]